MDETNQQSNEVEMDTEGVDTTNESVTYERCLRLLPKLDFYTELGIPKQSNVNRVRSAFHKLSQRWHPDLYVPVVSGNKTPVRTQVAAATEKFYCLAWMYEVLKDPELRRIYDQHGYEGVYKSETYQETSVFDLDPYDIYDGFWQGATEEDREYLLLHGPDPGSDDEGESSTREALRADIEDEEDDEEDLEELLSSVREEASAAAAANSAKDAVQLEMPRPPASLLMSSNMYKGPGNVGVVRNPIEHDVWKDLAKEFEKQPSKQAHE